MKLEEQLRELNQTMISQPHATNSVLSELGKKTSDVSMIALFMASSALLGYSVGRFHGRRSAIKRFVSLSSNPSGTPSSTTIPLSSPLSTPSSSSLSSSLSNTINMAAASIVAADGEATSKVNNMAQQEEGPKSSSSLETDSSTTSPPVEESSSEQTTIRSTLSFWK
jgi:hypothetical protein